jgi:hypothetical protein
VDPSLRSSFQTHCPWCPFPFLWALCEYFNLVCLFFFFVSFLDHTVWCSNKFNSVIVTESLFCFVSTAAGVWSGNEQNKKAVESRHSSKGSKGQRLLSEVLSFLGLSAKPACSTECFLTFLKLQAAKPAGHTQPPQIQNWLFTPVYPEALKSAALTSPWDIGTKLLKERDPSQEPSRASLWQAETLCRKNRPRTTTSYSPVPAGTRGPLRKAQVTTSAR